jgi:hypothetical protein
MDGVQHFQAASFGLDAWMYATQGLIRDLRPFRAAAISGLQVQPVASRKLSQSFIFITCCLSL